MSIVLKCYPWYSLLFLVFISLFIIIKSYDKKVSKYVVILSIIMTIFPYIIYKLNLTKYSTYQLISLTGNSLKFRLLNATVIFLIEFILYFIVFKLAKLIRKLKDNKIINTIFIFILSILIQILMWYIMKYLWLYVIKNISFNTDSWYSFTMLLISSIFIIFKSYEKDEIIYAVPLAIINMFYPTIYYNLNFKGVKAINYSFINIIITFVIQYIICFISLKISNRLINRNDHKLIYVFAFLILNTIAQIVYIWIYSLL